MCIHSDAAEHRPPSPHGVAGRLRFPLIPQEQWGWKGKKCRDAWWVLGGILYGVQSIEVGFHGAERLENEGIPPAG
jgi:hypothetical protein